MEQGSGLFYQRGTRDPVSEHMRVLIHSQDGHPVCCISGHANGAIELPHRIGEETSPRHDENSMITRGRTHCTADPIQRAGYRRESSPDLDHTERDGG